MRDPERIEKFCADLAEVWKNVPDWRFGQLIMNVFGFEGRPDVFYAEDDRILKHFQDYFTQIYSSPWKRS